MLEHRQLLEALVGLLGGVLVGATGIGGAALVTPALILGLGLPASTAIATDVVFCAIIKVFGLSAHRGALKEGQALLLRTLALSVPGALLGALGLLWLRGDAFGEALLSRLLGALVLFAAFSVFKQLRYPSPELLLLPASLGIGLMVGLTGIGAGTLFLPLLLGSAKVSFRASVAISIAQGLLLSSLVGLMHLAAGAVDLSLLAALTVGGAPGVLLGARLHGWMNVRVLARCVSALLVIAGLRLLL